MDGRMELFEAGEKVIYPQFGLGTIAEVTQKEVDGLDHSFYRLEFPLKQMEILVPVKRATENGLRKVMSEKDVTEVLDFLGAPEPCKKPQQWHRWRKRTLEQIKTGNPLEIVKIYCQLVSMEDHKGLSFTEKKILTQVEMMLVAEISAAKSLSEEETRKVMGIERKADEELVEEKAIIYNN